LRITREGKQVLGPHDSQAALLDEPVGVSNQRSAGFSSVRKWLAIQQLLAYQRGPFTNAEAEIRSRFSAVVRGSGILRDRDSARALKGCDAIGSIAVRAAQNNTDKALPLGGRRRTKHHVNGGPGEADQTGMCELNFSPRYKKGLVWRPDVNRIPRQKFAVLGLFRSLACLARQQASQLALMRRVEY
jgi:hypothetical protein